MSGSLNQELAKRLTGPAEVLEAWQAVHEHALELQSQRVERIHKEVKALRSEIQSWERGHEVTAAELDERLRTPEAGLAAAHRLPWTEGAVERGGLSAIRHDPGQRRLPMRRKRKSVSVSVYLASSRPGELL